MDAGTPIGNRVSSRCKSSMLSTGCSPKLTITSSIQMPACCAGPSSSRAITSTPDVAGQLVLVDEVRIDRHAPAVQSQIAAHHSAMLEQLRQDVAGHVDRDGETDSLRRLDDRRVDADHPAAAVDKRSAAVAGIQGRVGLNDVVDQVAGDAAQRAADRADDAGRHGRFKAERTADGHHELADAQLGGIAQLRKRQRRAFRLHDGQVGPGIVADHAAGQFLAVDQVDAHPLVVLHDVMIGEQEAVRRKQNARTGTLLPARPTAEIDDGGSQFFRHIDDHFREGVERIVFGPAAVAPVKWGDWGRYSQNAARIVSRLISALRDTVCSIVGGPSQGLLQFPSTRSIPNAIATRRIRERFGLLATPCRLLREGNVEISLCRTSIRLAGISLPFIVVSALFAQPAPMRDPQANPMPSVAATVNGQPIYESVMERALLGVPADEQKAARQEILDVMIQNSIIDQYLVVLKITVEPKEVDLKLEAFKEEVKKHQQDYARF